MRQFLVRSLSGQGVEFGAGCRPYSVPIGCKVSYADRFSDDEMLNRSSSARKELQDTDIFMPIDVVDEFDEMANFSDESVDFVLAAHVIEHVAEAIGAFETAYRVLRPGGKLVLAIPDIKRTRDRSRSVTPIQHLLAD